MPIQVVGTVINSPHFALDVRNGCNGVEAMMVLAAAMLAFPATLRSRLAGLLVGSVAIQILNLVRVSSLVWLGEHHRASLILYTSASGIDRDSGGSLDVSLLELEICRKTSRHYFLKERSAPDRTRGMGRLRASRACSPR